MIIVNKHEIIEKLKRSIKRKKKNRATHAAQLSRLSRLAPDEDDISEELAFLQPAEHLTGREAEL